MASTWPPIPLTPSAPPAPPSSVCNAIQLTIAAVAAEPEAKTSVSPPEQSLHPVSDVGDTGHVSSDVKTSSSADRVGLEEREYSCPYPHVSMSQPKM